MEVEGPAGIGFHAGEFGVWGWEVCQEAKELIDMREMLEMK
jgi:hypothetical protein